MRQGGKVVLRVSETVDKKCTQVNDICSEANAVVPSASTNITNAALDKFISIPGDKGGISESIYLPSSDLSASSPLASSGPSFRNRKYFYLFRPSDDDITVIIGNITQYMCTVCDGIYKQKCSLKRHFLRCHVNTWFISKADLTNCRISVPSETPDDNDSSDSKTANEHNEINSSNIIFLANNDSRVMAGLYKCHMCVNVSFDLEHELRSHYNGHSKDEKRELLSKPEYQTHTSTDAGGRKCKYCAKILSNPYNRKRHEALHLGLKPYICAHCGRAFAQKKDLDRHFRNRHGELYRLCPLSSQETLALHEREKHSTPKTAEKSSSSDEVSKPSTSKTPSPPFTLYNPTSRIRMHRIKAAEMAEGRQVAKDLNKELKKSKRMESNKADLNLELNKRMESSERVSHSGKLSASERKLPSLTFNSLKGLRSEPKFPSCFKEKNPKEEAETFYCNLSQNILKNLCNPLDGTRSDIGNIEYIVKDRHSPVLNERSQISWSKFNFPRNFDVDFALKSGGYEVQSVPENRPQNHTLIHATTLNNVVQPHPIATEVTHEVPVSLEISSSNTPSSVHNGADKNSQTGKGKKLIGRNTLVVFLCSLCKEKFESKSAFEEHCLNNHPNVDCSCVEIEANGDSSAVIHTYFSERVYSEKGVLFVCSVPLVITEGPYVCTKCNLRLDCREKFHCHIVECSGLNSSPSHLRGIGASNERIMKSRRNMLFRSSLKSFRPDEASEQCGFKSKKAQFFKGGPNQAKTISYVEAKENCYTTKPVKLPSKSDRRSYASLSTHYKESCNQLNSVERSKCKNLFASWEKLKLLVENHNLGRSSKKSNGNTFHSKFDNVGLTLPV